MKHGGGKRCESEDNGERYCESHAQHTAEDDKKRYCLHCLLSNHVSGDVTERMRRCVRKEIYVLADLERRLPWLEKMVVRVQWDLGTDGGCKGERPDWLLDFGAYVLIIEVDEGQHLQNCVSSEKLKMNHIWEQLGCRPMGYVRVNTDTYTDSAGVKHPGAFRRFLNPHGEPRLTSADNGEFEARMDDLQATVEAMVEHREEDVKFLCYSPENMYEADAADPELVAALAGLDVSA